MRELSLTILDIAENSLAASATEIAIDVSVDKTADLLTIIITDNGFGMDEETLRKVLSDDNALNVGMGLRLLRSRAELCGGEAKVMSSARGTTVKATYRLSHPDRPPLGDMESTLLTLLTGKAKIRFRFGSDDKECSVVASPIEWSKIKSINEKIKTVNGGQPL